MLKHRILPSRPSGAYNFEKRRAVNLLFACRILRNADACINFASLSTVKGRLMCRSHNRSNNLINKSVPTMGNCFKAPIYNRPGDYPVAPVTAAYPGAAVSTYQPGVAITTTTTNPGLYSGVAPVGVPRF